jgi:hypothetical protein
MRARIVDISRGGAAVRSDWTASAGTEVTLDLPGSSRPVTALTVRSGNGLLIRAFRQEEATLRLVDQALARIGGGPGTTAAA